MVVYGLCRVHLVPHWQLKIFNNDSGFQSSLDQPGVRFPASGPVEQRYSGRLHDSQRPDLYLKQEFPIIGIPLPLEYSPYLPTLFPPDPCILYSALYPLPKSCSNQKAPTVSFFWRSPLPVGLALFLVGGCPWLLGESRTLKKQEYCKPYPEPASVVPSTDLLTSPQSLTLNPKP